MYLLYQIYEIIHKQKEKILFSGSIKQYRFLLLFSSLICCIFVFSKTKNCCPGNSIMLIFSMQEKIPTKSFWPSPASIQQNIASQVSIVSSNGILFNNYFLLVFYNELVASLQHPLRKPYLILIAFNARFQVLICIIYNIFYLLLAMQVCSVAGS